MKPAAARIAALLVVALAGTSCSSNPMDAPPPTIPAASPASAPPATVEPAGTVRAAGSPTAVVFDAGVAALAVLIAGSADTSTVTVMDADTPRVIEIPALATAITSDGAGTAYLSVRGGYLEVDLRTGDTERVDVDAAADVDFTAIALREDGRVVLGSADGAVYQLAEGGEVANRLGIFARVDELATLGNTSVVLDRGQSSVTTVNAEGQTQQALRAGNGATSMAIDPDGRLLVANTREDELLVFGVDPLIMRQRYPVADAPYGIAGSAELAWVSETAANVVVGYDLATGIPVEKVRYPTVQQPDFLAFDDATGTLYVVSGSGAGVQVIESATDGP